MNARFMTAMTVCALALAAFSLAPQISAQSGAAVARGIFASLKVGNMVQLVHQEDSNFKLLLTWEEEAKKAAMKHRVKEIAHDYIVLEFDDRNGPLAAVVESRIPAAVVVLVHTGKSGGSSADEPLGDKPKKPGKGKK